MAARNSRVSGAIIFVIVLCGLNIRVQARFAGGSGDADNPFRIATTEHLLSIGSEKDLLGKCFVLVDDIDLHVGHRLSDGGRPQGQLVRWKIGDPLALGETEHRIETRVREGLAKPFDVLRRKRRAGIGEVAKRRETVLR